MSTTEKKCLEGRLNNLRNHFVECNGINFNVLQEFSTLVKQIGVCPILDDNNRLYIPVKD